MCVTRSAKIHHVGAKTDIHFIAQDYSYTIGLSIRRVSIGKCKEVWFFGGHFADPMKPQM